MAFNFFRKSKKKEEKAALVAQQAAPAPAPAMSQVAGTSAYRVLRSFYVSEKATRLAGGGQYIFVVAPDANKEEIKKQVSKLYGVTVVNVRVLNMPKKRKDLARHPGFRSGFRKAIVRLAAGQTIAQATP